MKPIFNIFTILNQFLIDMILRIAQNIEDRFIQTYHVNYQFQTSDTIHSFEMPIILEVRDENEMKIIHSRIINEITCPGKFIMDSVEKPILIDEDKKNLLLRQNAILDNSEIKAEFKFTISDENISLNKDVSPVKLNIKLISTKKPKDVYGKKIYAISDISHLFKFTIPTELK
ncbi:MAG: hypothetical protein BGO88_08930 [Flavobacterium sp. 38-13]|uniref:hypothetical protein n=1 Tax=Flavobacterium sp. 38-13 TaxID=1896168 RepID=UPI000965B050|nr:hypothetical protein [Flavobacterium sp. 38-13]OJX49864.1 MAG: hypothetical protein BGO88_08930 [Flavobacterium sp. 38-13]